MCIMHEGFVAVCACCAQEHIYIAAFTTYVKTLIHMQRSAHLLPKSNRVCAVSHSHPLLRAACFAGWRAT
jgi:hypothetical protein